MLTPSLPGLEQRARRPVPASAPAQRKRRLIPVRPEKWLTLLHELEALARLRRPRRRSAGAFAYYGTAAAGSLTGWDRRAAWEAVSGLWAALPGDGDCQKMARAAFQRASEPKTARLVER